MFIQTESTPNPATLKFLPGQDVLGDGHAADFPNATAAERSPLAKALFEVDGVVGVFFGADFVTITKGDVEWQHIKPALLGAIMQHFTSGAPLMTDNVDTVDPNEVMEDDSEIVGQITFQGFDKGVVYLNMVGACAGCPASTQTLKHGVENMLKHFVPEIEEVRAV